MIIENGTLQVMQKTGGGFDKNGLPQKVQNAPGEPIPCNIKTLNHDKKGKYIDGTFSRFSYEILLDIETTQNFTADRVRLTDNRGNVIGDFQVQDVQHLDAVGAIKISV
ncbi:hypothetical protein EVA_06626 [gut metagenome]|uniref:Uncharacterized protein n=1 Tax=gut metagenome TaxID=749906 RepID=J9GX47_9ZZZZ